MKICCDTFELEFASFPKYKINIFSIIFISQEYWNIKILCWGYEKGAWSLRMKGTERGNEGCGRENRRGAVFSFTGVWYVAGRCWPLRLCHITQVSSSQLYTLPGPERWGGGLGLNYRVHMWQIYRYKKGKKSEFRQIEWKKDSKILACCWLRVFCVHFFKGVVSPEEIGISQSENPDSEFEGLGDYEESFVAEWWQEPKTKWDTGEVTDWHLSLSPVQNASSSSSVPPRQHTKGCWPPYRQTFPTVFSRKSTTHSCVFSTSNLSIMLIEIRDWHILSWLSSAF